jgi:hypothetical protein
LSRVKEALSGIALKGAIYCMLPHTSPAEIDIKFAAYENLTREIFSIIEIATLNGETDEVGFDGIGCMALCYASSGDVESSKQCLETLREMVNKECGLKKTELDYKILTLENVLNEDDGWSEIAKRKFREKSRRA